MLGANLGQLLYRDVSVMVFLFLKIIRFLECSEVPGVGMFNV